MMLLSEVLNGVDFEKILGEFIDISKITIDSRTACKGSLFVCIKGLSSDGHDYIDKAVENGACAVLCDRKLDQYPEGICVILVEDSREALSKIAANFYGNPQKSLNMIGVTGTNGKTSVTYFLETILNLDGRVCGVIGTSGVIANKTPLNISYATSTTPDTIELYEILAEMKKLGVTDVLMEVTSHALALKKVDGIQFSNGIFTNLTQDHLDFHKTLENYLNCKIRLFKASKYGIINADDDSCEKIKSEASCEIITYSIDNPSNFKAENVKYEKDGTSFSVQVFGDWYNFRLNIPGKFSVYNALSAIVTCLNMGISVRTIVDGVSLIKNVPGRIQPVQNDKGFGVFVDYAHTPDGLDNIIKSVKFFTKGRVITVFGCGGDRDTTKRPIMGKLAGELSDFCIITSDNPRSEDPSDIIAQVETGMLETGCEYIKEPDRREAIFKAIGMAREGDSVILAGKGHENYQEFENKRRIFFDDAVVAKEALEGLK